MLEEKDEVKKRLGRSPDKADALALTFAEPVFEAVPTALYQKGQISWEDMFTKQNGDAEKW